MATSKSTIYYTKTDEAPAEEPATEADKTTKEVEEEKVD